MTARKCKVCGDSSSSTLGFFLRSYVIAEWGAKRRADAMRKAGGK